MEEEVINIKSLFLVALFCHINHFERLNENKYMIIIVRE